MAADLSPLTSDQGTVRSADGTALHWQAWVPAGAGLTLAVIHGLGDHGSRYARLAAAMAEHGIATYAVDLRGHGQSEGRRGHVERWDRWVEDAAALIDLAGSQGPGEVVPLGHSFGGAVLLSAVTGGAVKPTRFALSSPALRLKLTAPAWKVAAGRLLSNLVPTLAMGNEVDPAAISREPEVVAAYRADPLVHDRITTRTYTEWLSAVERIFAAAGQVTAPFFAAHGLGDKVIDPQGTADLCRLAAGAHPVLKLYPDRYHEPFNDAGSSEVFADLATWLRAPS